MNNGGTSRLRKGGWRQRVVWACTASLAVAGGLAMVPSTTASAATRPAATTRLEMALPAGMPTRLLSDRAIVVIRPARPGRAAELGRIVRISRSGGVMIASLVRVPANALEPRRFAMFGKGRTIDVPVGLVGASSSTVHGADLSPSCSDGSGSVKGSVSFSPSAGGSLGVTWVNVFEGIIYLPEISGGISFSPNTSVSLSGEGFSGSCEDDFSAGEEEIATVDTFAGPLSLCFGASGEVGASVSGSVSQSLSAGLHGAIGTNFHFGVTGAGLNPFNNVGPSGGASSPSAAWSGSIYIGGGPYLLAEWGVCDVGGVGVQAGLNSTFTLTGASSGWTASVSESVNASVNLNLLDYSYSQTIDNWNLFTDTLASGSWPSSGGGGGGGCGLRLLSPSVITC
jgi:hypothetical protein